MDLPWHISPSNPKWQTQVPVETSHSPWYEQVPSPGHCKSVKIKLPFYLTLVK